MAKEAIRIEGGDGGRCSNCSSLMYFSYVVHYSDGTKAKFCRVCTPGGVTHPPGGKL